MVHFATELDPRELPAALSALAGVVPWSFWQKRVANLRSDVSRNPTWERFILERHGLELALSDIRKYQRTTGRCPWPPRTAEEYRLVSFVAVLLRVHAHLGPQGKMRLSGAIRSALEKEAGLGPLALEMKVAGHLMSRGFDVSFNDLERGGGFDFLARKGDVELEVECKHVSADIGRQIHRRKMYDLGGVLYPILSKASDREGGGRLVRVLLPGRLKGDKLQHRAIKDIVAKALDGEEAGTSEVCQVNVHEFDIEGSVFDSEPGRNLSLDDVGLFVRSRFELDDAHILAHWRPGRSAVIVHFTSVASDRVLDEIFKKLKSDASRQFTGNRPAFMCVHLADLTQEQLVDLAKADRQGEVTGIQAAISTLLNKRIHLHGVALMTDGVVEIGQGNRKSRLVRESGPAYVFANPSHPDADNDALRGIFG